MIQLQLPGQAMPFTDSPIFAQTSGYLKKWYFDIGARVKKGDVLAQSDLQKAVNGTGGAESEWRASGRDLCSDGYQCSH
ncbi:MAG: efflux RND transporter periplasmic adaptor subunit [Verrucomicrobia bacterium]|nr:efflux RND transporter periplasmic adaptor subunit [Verrucomicrobiota bacterium]